MMTVIYNPRCAVQAMEVRPVSGMFFMAPHPCMKVRRVSGIMQLIPPIPREQWNLQELEHTRWWDKSTTEDLLLEALSKIAHLINSMGVVSTLLLDQKFPMESRLRYSAEIDSLVEDAHIFRASAFVKLKQKTQIYESDIMTQWLKPDPDNYQ